MVTDRAAQAANPIGPDFGEDSHHIVRRVPQNDLMSTADVNSCQCASGFIHVVDWTDLDEEHWWLRTRCGDCGSFRDIVIDRAQAEAFEKAMRTAEQQLRAQADWWARSGMRQWTERFLTALRCDAVAPMDF